MSFRLRRGLETDRTSITPLEGEPLYTIDDKKFYIGDGVTAGGNLVGGFSIWGTITGVITDQTDLITYLGSNYYPLSNPNNYIDGTQVPSFETDPVFSAWLLTSPLSGYVPTSRNLTINGVTYDLSADRSWSVGDLLSSGSYSNPTWLTALAWSKISGKPTTLAGYGITDAIDGSGTTNEIPYFVDSNTLGSLTTATYPSLTELSYVKGVTSAVQTQINLKEDKATSSSGSVISFTTPQIYGSIASPSNGDITDDLTGARIGVIQKIYHNKLVAPTFPAGWVRLGSVTYNAGNNNIIYAEWVSGTRVEYWIVRL